jgi:hypothetical protein
MPKNIEQNPKIENGPSKQVVSTYEPPKTSKEEETVKIKSGVANPKCRD